MMHPVLEAKLLLEREIARPLYKAGETYIQAWGRQNGNLSAFERMGHQDAIRNVLQRHYARVVMVMTGRAPSKTTTLAEAALSLQHMDWLHTRALDHAQLILRSIDGELASGMAETALQHVVDDHTGSLFGIKSETKADDDKPKTVDRIKMAVTRAVNKLKSKLGLIATTETNGVAEDARRRAAEAEAQLKAGTLMKRWISLMDGRERPSHHAGHNDYSENPIPIAQPFVIGGANLMFPGDQSMGAPLKEVINCRCSCVYTLLNPDGTHSPVAATPHAPTRRYARGPNPSHPVPNFRGPSPGPPLKPTSVVTLNGRTRARVVLRDARTIATMRQVTPSTIEVSVSGRVVGRATVQNGRATRVVVDKNYRGQGIEDLIRRSVTHSHQRRPEAVR